MNTSRDSNSLETRHRHEAKFHDKKYGTGEGYPRHYAVNPTYPIYQRMLGLAGNLEGKSVLEYGCGEGWITKDLALAGARVSGFDISAEAVRKTKSVLSEAGVIDACDVAQMSGEALQYPDEMFDIAFGFAILHHLDIEMAIEELYRVLKPGGVALFGEPLGTNPFINLYRRWTPQYRTEHERPLDLEALRPMLSRFQTVSHTDCYVTALAAVAVTYLPYGKHIYSQINRWLMRLDDALLRHFPRLGKWAWYTILVLKK